MKLVQLTFRLTLLMALAAAAGAGPVLAVAPAIPAAVIFNVNSQGDAIAFGPLDSGPCRTAAGNTICTLRAAVMKANHLPGGGAIINLPAGVYQLSIGPSGPNDETTGDLNLTASMSIVGAGAASTIVDANGIDRVMVTTGSAFTLTALTLRNGWVPGNGGGGIYSAGPLTLNSVRVTGNRGVSGGGIYNLTTLTLNNSLVDANIASDAGGGIYSSGSAVNLNNSTLSNNSAAASGGGLVTQGTTTIYFSTIAGNLADSDGSGAGLGGGIRRIAGTVVLRGSLLAENLQGLVRNECASTATSQGYNLLQDDYDCVLGGVTTGNLLNVDPRLLPLLNNGGPTPTRALLAGSQAINAVPSAQCLDPVAAPLTSDQRGALRPTGGACDIGAFEGSVPATLFGVNLLRNGDAETAAGSPAGATIYTPHWNVTEQYSPTVVSYRAGGGYPTLTDPGPADRGDGFFSGGVNALSQVTQTVDVSALAAAIDAGQVLYHLSGYFGGFASQDDYALLLFQFFDGENYSPPVGIGQVSAADRANQTKLLYREASGTVPAGTTTLVLTLYFSRIGGGFNDGYADNLALVLSIGRLYLPLVVR